MTIAPIDKKDPSSKYTITWEKLPRDYPLPDDPVDNIIQPELAIALKESLDVVGLTTESMLIATNFAICATVEGKTVVKAPDWVYVANVLLTPAGQIRRSYTPIAEGDLPAIVMEFLSETEGTEYSMKPNYPYGKWWFYERILQVPIYVIFDPVTSELEVYHLVSGHYELQTANADHRYWIEPLNLYLGIWQGTRYGLTAFWLRWWTVNGTMLLWSTEQLQLAQQQAQLAQEQAQLAQEQAQSAQEQAEQERQQREWAQQQADQERIRAEQLAQRLRTLGIDPDDLS